MNLKAVKNSRIRKSQFYFCEDDSMYTVMKRQLEGYEAPFIYVTSGERFEDCRNGRFTMNFAKDEDYDALCGVLRSQNIKPRHIIHFWLPGSSKIRKMQ